MFLADFFIRLLSSLALLIHREVQARITMAFF